jgi:hypothetical protein
MNSLKKQIDDKERKDSKRLALFLDLLLKNSLEQEGVIVPLTSSRFQRLSWLVEGVAIDD